MVFDEALTGSDPEVVECVGRELRKEFLSDIPCVGFSSRRFRDDPYKEVEPEVSERDVAPLVLHRPDVPRSPINPAAGPRVA